MTTYMLVYTIRNIQNEVRKKKKISSKRSKNGKIRGKKLIEKKGKVSCNFNFTMSYRYDILIKTTLCTAVFYTVQTEQAGDFLGPGRK